MYRNAANVMAVEIHSEVRKFLDSNESIIAQYVLNIATNSSFSEQDVRRALVAGQIGANVTSQFFGPLGIMAGFFGASSSYLASCRISRNTKVRDVISNMPSQDMKKLLLIVTQALQDNGVTDRNIQQELKSNPRLKKIVEEIVLQIVEFLSSRFSS